MKNIIKERDDILFYIKMYPLKSHPEAYDKSKAVVCSKSLKMLEDAFAGKKLPEPSCETSEVDDTIKLAESLGITATPTIILPDGAIVPGYKDAAALVALIEQAGESVGISKGEGAEEATEEASEESGQDTAKETSEAADEGRQAVPTP